MEVLFIIGTFITCAVVYSVLEQRRMNKLAAQRGDPNICAFARSFDRRTIDTKIIREVWNEVQESLGSCHGNRFPVQVDDLFKETYNLDADDLDDAYFAIAERLDINTQNPEENPYWNKVWSVQDLVQFLNYQSKTEKVK